MYPYDYVLHPDDAGILRTINTYQKDSHWYYLSEYNVTSIPGMTKVSPLKWVPIKMVGVHLILSIFLFLFETPFFTNVFLLILSSFFIYLLAEKITNRKMLAFVSSILFFSFPPILFWSGVIMGHFTFMTFFLFAYYFLFTSKENFKDNRIILFFLFSFIAIIIRYEFLFFFIIFLLINFFMSRRKEKYFNSEKFILILFLAIFVCSVVLFFNLINYGNPFSTGYTNIDGQEQETNSSEKSNKISSFDYFMDRFLEIDLKATIRNIFLFIFKIIHPFYFILFVLGFLYIIKNNKINQSFLFLFFISFSFFFFYGTSKNYYIFSKALLLSSYTRYFLVFYLLLIVVSIYGLKNLNNILNKNVFYFTIIFILIFLLPHNLEYSINNGLKEGNQWISNHKEVHSLEGNNSIFISDTLAKAITINDVIVPSGNKTNLSSFISLLLDENKDIYIAEYLSHPGYTNYLESIQKSFILRKINEYPTIFKVIKEK